MLTMESIRRIAKVGLNELPATMPKGATRWSGRKIDPEFRITIKPKPKPEPQAKK